MMTGAERREFILLIGEKIIMGKVTEKVVEELYTKIKDKKQTSKLFKVIFFIIVGVAVITTILILYNIFVSETNKAFSNTPELAENIKKLFASDDSSLLNGATIYDIEIEDNEVKQKYDVSELYRQQNDYPNAIYNCKLALDLQSKKYGDADPITAKIMSNLGVLYFNNAEYGEANKYFLNAMATLKEKYDDISILYNNIALVFQAIGEYGEAIRYYKEAFKIAETEYNNNIEIDAYKAGAALYNGAQINSNLSITYLYSGNYDKAMEHIEYALNFYEDVFGDDHIITAKTYQNLGLIYKSKGDYSTAYDIYKKSLDVIEDKLPYYDSDRASAYCNMAYVLEMLGDDETALDYYEKSISIREKIFGDSHPDTALSYDNAAALYCKLGDCDKALKLSQKALLIFESKYGKYHIDTSIAYQNIGIIYFNMQDYPKAISYYTETVSICKKIKTDEIRIAEIYCNIGVSSLYNDDAEKAIDFLNQALDIFKKNKNQEYKIQIVLDFINDAENLLD